MRVSNVSRWVLTKSFNLARFDKLLKLDCDSLLAPDFFSLCNRLRALVSAFNIAQATQRQLVIIWVPDMHCEARFTDLFRLNFLLADVKVRDSQPACWMLLSRSTAWGAETPAPHNTITTETKRTLTTRRRATSTSASTAPGPRTTCFSKTSRRSSKSRREVFQFERQLLAALAKLVGVYIRMGQANYAFEDTSHYSAAAHASITKWRSASHWSVFADHTTKHPTQLFLACADNEEALSQLLTLPNVVTVPRSLEQVRSALVDLILLSKTRELRGMQQLFGNRAAPRRPHLAARRRRLLSLARSIFCRLRCAHGSELRMINPQGSLFSVSVSHCLLCVQKRACGLRLPNALSLVP